MDSSASAAAGLSLFTGFIFCIICIASVIIIGGTIFWVLMLVDAVKREWNDRQVWIIILILSFVFSFHIFAAIIYYFAVKKPNIGTLKP